MANEFEMKKPRDLNTINTKEMGELLWWSHYLGITPERLLSIIQDKGNIVAEVKKQLHPKSN